MRLRRSARNRQGRPVRREARGRLDVGLRARGDEVAQADSGQHARPNASGVTVARERHHRHSHPQRLASGKRTSRSPDRLSAGPGGSAMASVSR